MKRNFLLMLLLTLLPLAGWANKTVNASGDYTATVEKAFTVNEGALGAPTYAYVLSGQGLPKVSGISLLGEPVDAANITPALNAEGVGYQVYKRSGTGVVLVESVNGLEGALPIGNYFLKFQVVGNNTVNALYVPFKVLKKSLAFDVINSATSFTESYTQGGLQMYYNYYSWSDWGLVNDQDECTKTLEPGNVIPGFADMNYNQKIEAWNNWANGQTSWEYVRTWATAVAHEKGAEPFPWIVPYLIEEEAVRLLFHYKGDVEQNNVLPWGTGQNGLFGTATGARKFGAASVSHEFGVAAWGIGQDPTKQSGFASGDFEMYLWPANEDDAAAPAVETVTRTDISTYTLKMNNGALIYNGQPQYPTFTAGEKPVNAYVLDDVTTAEANALTEGVDFTVSYTNNFDYTNAGINKPVTITGVGNYKGSFNSVFTISAFPVDGDNFHLEYATGVTTPLVYNGLDQKPSVSVVGGAALDPTSNQLTVLGTDDFEAVLTKAGVDGPQTQAINAGGYTFTISPKGNYTAKIDDTNPVVITETFTINQADLSGYAVVMPKLAEDDPTTTSVNEEVKGYIYNTKEQKPKFTGDGVDAAVTAVAGSTEPLKYGTDYTVAFLGGDYTNVGTKEFTINATEGGNYTGSIDVAYKIDPKDIASTDITRKFTAPTYNPQGGAQITADNFDYKFGTVALVMGTNPEEGDFTWAWATGSDGESAGPQTLDITGRGNYTGTTTENFNLKPYTVTITPADAQKYYGEEDPAPDFAIDANSALQIERGSEEWLYIQSFLTMERDGSDPKNSKELKEQVLEGGHNYIVKKKEYDAAECNYDIVIQNNTAILNIYPAPLTVTVANNSKVYSGDPTTDPNFITDKDNTHKFAIANAAGEDVTNAKDYVDATKNLKEVLNISRKPGEDVVYENHELSGYDFTWDNPNYDVTFMPAKFTITPKRVTAEAEFLAAGYEYKGAEWKPIPTVTYTENGTKTTLNNPKDFLVTWAPGTGLNDLINVTEGTNTTYNRWPKGIVTANPEGNYTFANTDAKTEAYFHIFKTELNISAIADNSKEFGTNDPTPLAEITFAQGKGPKGRDTYNTTTGETNITFSKPLIIREEGEHTGNYVISINPAATTRNYNIVSTATANFHIYRSQNAFVISFDPTPKDITYGDAIDLKDLVKVNAPQGYTGSASVTADLLKYAKNNVKKYQVVEGEKTYIDTNNAGTYKLTIDDAPTALAGGYSVIVDEGILNINAYPLYIISYGEKEYGDEEPDYTWDVYEYVKVGNTWKYVKSTREDIEVPEADFIGGNAHTGWGIDPNYNHYTISRVAGETVNDYVTTIRPWRNHTNIWEGRKYYGENDGVNDGIEYNGNYSYQFVDGIFKIKRRSLNVEIAGASKKYGEYDPEKPERVTWLEPRTEEEAEDNVEVFEKGLVKIIVTNALTKDEAEAIANKVNYGSRDAGEVVKTGGYTVKNVVFNGVSNPGTNEVNNYSLSYTNNAKFMIEKRLLKVTAHDQSVPYANPLVVDPYDLSITDGILYNNVYQYPDANNPDDVDGINVYYDTDVTTMPKGAATDNKAINDRVDKIFKPLEVAEGKTKVGEFHKEAFKLELTEFGNQNYEIEFTNGKLYIEQATTLYLDMANLAQALNDHIGRTVEVKLCGAPEKEEGCDPFRQFVAYQWNTLVLPFTAMPREIAAAFRYAAIDILNEDNDNEGSFSLAVTTKRIPANTPFIFQADKNWRYDGAAGSKPTDITFGQREIADFDYLNEDPTATDAAGNKFIGTYKPKSDFTADDYIMRENTGEFFRFVAGADGVAPSYAMRQTNAYLESASAAPVRIFIDNEDGSVTAIKFVGADARTSTMEAEGWYTIDGMKLNAAPTQKGIYIKDGKKVAVK